jgi:hypothetical protein
MPRRLLACLLLVAPLLNAHQIPNITLEAMFAADSGYTLRINLDPRVFLSAQPTALPPVEATWYLNQSEAERRETHLRAAEYLRKNLGLRFGTTDAEWPVIEITAIDGTTLEPLKPDTAETHLLAVAKGRVPGSGHTFELVFGPDANVSLILLNSEQGKPERRPQVLFPGESSRPYKLTPTPVLAPPPAVPPRAPAPRGLHLDDALLLLGVPLILLAVAWRLHRTGRGRGATSGE